MPPATAFSLTFRRMCFSSFFRHVCFVMPSSVSRRAPSSSRSSANSEPVTWLARNTSPTESGSCTAFTTQSTVASRERRLSRLSRLVSRSRRETVPSLAASRFDTTVVTAASISDFSSRDLSLPKMPEMRYCLISEAVRIPEPSASSDENCVRLFAVV